MITFIWLTAVIIIALGAAMAYKSVGRKGRIIERQTNASSQNATVGRASGSGDN